MTPEQIQQKCDDIETVELKLAALTQQLVRLRKVLEEMLNNKQGVKNC